MTHHNNDNQGFALFMAIIIVSVVVSIGLSVLDLTIKQLKLSTNSKDSETAFHAANAGLECARYWREEESDDMDSGLPISPSCFGVSSIPVEIDHPTYTGFQSHTYEMEVTWGGTGAIRCSQIKILTITSDAVSPTIVTDMTDVIPGYPYGDVKSCEPGGRCTVISVRGYSRDCANIGLSGTVQREVLLEL